MHWGADFYFWGLKINLWGLFLDVAMFDASATSANPSVWDGVDEKERRLQWSYNELRNLASSFAPGWAEAVAKDDEALALDILNAVDDVVSYARERVFG